MTSNPMRKLALAFALFVLPLAFAAPALAARTTTQVVSEDFTIVDTVLCGFPITLHQSGTFKIVTFYDGAGSPVKSILTNFNVRFTETATANGKTLIANFPAVYITSLASGASVQTGLRANYTVPGAGAVAIDAGRISFDSSGNVVFEAGRHQIQDGNLTAFCGYFAG